MSKPEQLQLNCPSCSKSQSMTVWSSVNATLDAQLKEKLMKGDLNFFECNNCQERGRLPWDLLYHDMKPKVMIRLVHADHTSTDYLRDLPDRARIMLEPFFRTYQLRIVTSFSHLVEKIRLFDHGLDDRVVEFIKYLIWERHGPKQYPPDEHLFFRMLDNDQEKESELRFALFDKSGNGKWIGYSWHSYLDAVTFICEQLGDLSDCKGSWLAIDRNFVLRTLAKDGG